MPNWKRSSPAPAQVFIPKSEQKLPGLAVGMLLDKKPIKGEVGIEIEVEGKRLPHQQLPAAWTYHQDHSLRGQEHAEYVLAKPIAFDQVHKALGDLWDLFRVCKSKFDDSNRTSVHVHLNCQTWHFNRLASFMGMYFALEEILTEYCGEYRVGNLFCLRAKDAPAVLNAIKKFIQSDGMSNLNETLRYGGLNPHAMIRYGSIEIRTLRGTSDPSVVEEWVSILERLYKYSAEFNDPRDVCTLMSAGGSLNFFETLLGDRAAAVRKVIGWTDSQIRDSVLEGIRMSQDICYCRDWNLYEPVSLKPDPFKRSPRKIIGHITAALSTGPTASAPAAIADPHAFDGYQPVTEEEPDYDDEDDYPEDDD